MNSPCSNFKFDRQDEIKWYHKIWNHWLNPFSNFHEPLCYPEKRLDDYQTKKILFGLIPARWIPETIYWTILRNPLHNFTHFWIGITPIGERYEWISPKCKGYVRKLMASSWQGLETEGFEWDLWAWENPEGYLVSPAQVGIGFLMVTGGIMLAVNGFIGLAILAWLAAAVTVFRNFQFKFWFRAFGSHWNGYIGCMSRGNFGAAFRK